MASPQQIQQGIHSILSIPANQRTAQDNQDLTDLISEYNSAGSGFTPAPQQGQAQPGQQGQGQQGQGQGSDPPVQNGQPPGAGAVSSSNHWKGGLANLPIIGKAIGAFGQWSDDMTDTALDSAFRGLGNKILGPEAQANAQAARNRLGVVGRTVADIGGMVAGTPPGLNVTSTAGAIGLGAGEGALNTYGHQKNWVPSTPKEYLDIGTGAAIGGITGGVASKAADLLYGGAARKAASAANEANFPVDEAELGRRIADNVASINEIKASGRAPGGVPDTLGPELAGQAANVQKIKDAVANGASREELAKIVAGMKDVSPEAQKIGQEIGSKGNPILQKAGDLASHISYSGNKGGVLGGLGIDSMLTSGLHLLGVPTGAVTAARGTAEGIKQLAARKASMSPAEVEQLVKSILNPGGVRVNPQYSNVPRDILSKIAIGATTR